MKTQVCKYVLFAAAALVISSQAAFCADNTPPDKAAPGTAESQDTKTQMNNPSGPVSQKTAAVPPDTKKVQNESVGPNATNIDKSGKKATKKPQKDMAPSTTNP